MRRLMSFRRPLNAPSAPLPVVYRWDIDKTYLKNEFNTLRELVRIGFEKAEDKVAAPGVAALIRSLRLAAERQERPVRVYFISASPPQIGREIRKKLELDGIVYDGIVFKDQLQRLVRGKFRHLREQVGFKISELLKARIADPPDAREYAFGDDWESDPLIYSLYADVVAGRVGADELGELLVMIRAEPVLVDAARTLARALVPRDSVARVFINLERRTPPAHFRAFGPRLVPTHNYFQTAACLFEEGVLDAIGVAAVARDLLASPAYTPERLVNALDDIARRGHLSVATLIRVREEMEDAGLFPSRRRRPRQLWRALAKRLLARVRRPAAPALASVPAMIDYRTLVAGQPPAESSHA